MLYIETFHLHSYLTKATLSKRLSRSTPLINQAANPSALPNKPCKPDKAIFPVSPNLCPIPFLDKLILDPPVMPSPPPSPNPAGDSPGSSRRSPSRGWMDGSSISALVRASGHAGRERSRDPPARAASLTASCGRIAGNGLDPQGNCVFQPIMAGEDVRHRSLEETSPGLGHRGMPGSWRVGVFGEVFWVW